MRCYHLNNFYMGTIHAGIQSAHAQHELMLKYVDPQAPIAKSPYWGLQIEGYLEWARNHKTIIVLNAGMQVNLEKWVELLSDGSHGYAWAPFHESQEALNGALTNIALVLPERIYGYARNITKVRDMEQARRTVNRIDTGVECLYFNTDGGGKLCDPNGDELVFTTFELQLMSDLSKCSLM